MSYHDYMELVCENGKILTQGSPGRTQRLTSVDQNSVSLQNHRSESMTDLYQAECDGVSEHNRINSFNKNLTDAQIVPVHDKTKQNARSSSKHQKVRAQEMVNFSLFLRPPSVNKVNNKQSSVAPRSSGNPCVVKAAHGNNNPVESTLIDTANGAKSTKNHQNQPNLRNKTEMKPPNARSVVESVRHEQSAAVGRLSRLVEKENCDVGGSTAPLVASSTCSRGASNDPNYILKRRYEETERSAHLSNNFEEESEDMMTQVSAQMSKAVKRKRTAEVHSISERRRRDKINRKMRALQELIPNSNKVDKVSMLDEAIAYMKSLQLQLQMMSMGSRFFTPPMMLPLGMQQMNSPNFARYPPMGVGMGMRMHMGIGCNPAQFLSSPISGIGDARHLLGFPGQTMPMSMPRPPLFSVPEGSPTQLASEATIPQQLQKSASFPSLNDAMRKNEQEMANNNNAECPKSRTFSQAENKNPNCFAAMKRND